MSESFKGGIIKEVEKVEKIKRWFYYYKQDLYPFFVLGVNAGMDANDLLYIRECDFLDKHGNFLDTVKGCFMNIRAKTVVREHIRPRKKPVSVFINSNTGKLYNRQSINRYMKQAAKDDSINVFSMKRTYLYHAVRMGVPWKWLTASTTMPTKEVLERFIEGRVEDICEYPMEGIDLYEEVEK